MTALTKAAITESLHMRLGLNKREAKEFVEAFFEAIRGNLEQGQTVRLSGLGNFNLRDKGWRPGRNPRTNEPADIDPRRVVTFHAGQKLKTIVEQYAGGGVGTSEIKAGEGY